MDKKVLIIALSLLFSGCQTQSSFHIPLFNEIINYENDEALKSQNEKDAMYYIMLGGIELNQGKTKRAIDYYEKAMTLSKNSKIAYNLLNIYYKQNDIQNVKRIAQIITDNKMNKSNAPQEELIVSLINDDNEKSSQLISAYLTNNSTNYSMAELDAFTRKYKEIADIFSFLNVDIDNNNLNINNDNLILIKFYYLYNADNDKNNAPDTAITYLIQNKNINNIHHNFAVFKTAYLENYDSRLYKDSLLQLLNKVNDYSFEMNALDKLKNIDDIEYQKLKTTSIQKYSNDTKFWHILSSLEYSSNTPESSFYASKAYEVMMKNDPNYNARTEIIARLVYSMINQKVYNVKPYINQLESENDRKNAYSYLVNSLIENKLFKPSIIEDYKNIIKVKDLYIITAKAYLYQENYREALEYMDRVQILYPNSIEVNINRIFILAEINPVLASSDANALYQKNKTVETELLVYYMWAIQKKNASVGIQRVGKIYEDMIDKNFKYDDLKVIPLYLLSQFNYIEGNYLAARSYMDKMEVNYNYVYLADYGRILWKLNNFEEAKTYFKKSKAIKNSQYLEKILKELNIKNLGE